MSRSNPDPVFAAAAQAELERRVRSSSTTSRAPLPRRPWRMEFVAIAGVLLLVGGVAVGVGAIRPVLDIGTAVGSITDSPTTEPTTDPSATPFVAPTTDAPTTPPTTLAPTTPTVIEPTTPPTSTPSTTVTTPPPAGGTSALIGPTGAKQRTSAEIRTWALSIGNGDIWAQQAVLDSACMADHGFVYDPEFDHDAGLAAQKVGMTAAQYQAFQDALWGPQTDAPYDWRTAGCHGLSVHVTGQDHAN